MGFFDDLLRGATAPGVIQNGMNVGIGGMAEAQRQREMQAALQKQQEQQAFLNMFKQKEFDYGVGRDQIADQRYDQEYQDNKYLQQTGAAEKLGFNMLDAQNQIADNVRQDKLVNAQVQNLAEPNNKYAAGFGGGGQQQGGFDPETAAKLAQQDAYKMAQQVDEYGDPTGQVDPIKFDEIVRQRYQFYVNFNPAPQQRPPLPQGGAELLQGVFNGQPQQQKIVPLGAQGQPMKVANGQVQPQMNRAAMLKQKFDADPSSLTPEEFDELGQYLNGGN